MNPMLSSLIEQRIDKNGLIIYSKGIDFFSNTKLKRSQLNPFGSYIQKQYDNYSQVKSIYFSFYLYYKGETDPKAIEQFKLQIEFPSQIVKEAVTKEHLLLLYNIIEFEDKFKTRNENDIKNLLTQLMKFDSSQKTLEEFLLFTYYRGVLNFYLKNYNESNEQFMTVIIDINEEVGNDIKKYPFIHYLVLKNNLFMWRISQMMFDAKKRIGLCDSSELIVLSLDMFSQFQKISPVNAIKIGLILFDLYYEKKNYANAYQKLTESSQLLKKTAFCGNAIDNAPELSLQIISKLAYISVFLLKGNILKLAKKMQKKYLLLEGYLKKTSLIKKVQYSFCLYCLNNITERKDAPFSSTSSLLTEYKSLLNQQDINYEVYLVNFYCLKSLDQMSMKIFSEKLEGYVNTLKSNKPLFSANFIPCFFYVFNYISGLTKSNVTENNTAKQRDNNNLIRIFSDYLLNYTKAFYNDTDLKELFQLPYVKIILIKIAFCRCSSDLFGNRLPKLREALNDFDKNKHMFVNNEQSVLNEYAIIIKLKGDLEFKQENYMKAANYYQESLKYMKNHKMMALVHYDLGICYYCLKNLKKAKNNINESLNQYQRLLQEKPSWIEIQSKIRKIEMILKRF